MSFQTPATMIFFQTLRVFNPFVALKQMKTKGTTRGRTGSSGGGGRDQLNKIQLKAIGLAGEVIAFEWLKRQYPKEANEGCWKSSYRDFVIGEPKGNDSLGFDFEIILKSRTIY